MGKTSPWTATRLTRLFERYRQRYWPRSRRLARYQIHDTTLPGSVQGRCEVETRVLCIDVSKHTTDRDVRSTVLHEMIHAVLERPGRRAGHRAPFWRELEALLARHAPITIGFAELGECGSVLGIIPRRFRRCRKLFRPVHDREQRRLARATAQAWITLKPIDLEIECHDMAVNGFRWRAIWGHQARTYGLVDLDGRVPPWAKPFQQACRRGYQHGRRFFREDEKLRQRFEQASALERQ